MLWSEDDVGVAGVRLQYRRGGRGTPVLLLHGVTDSGVCWGRAATRLADTHEVILLDQRAHGGSDAPPSGYQLRDFAADVAGVMRELDIPPAAVVGHSLGARVAAVLARTCPQLVTRIVLEDPPLNASWSDTTDRGASADEARLAWFQWIRELQHQSRDELVELCRTRSPAWSAEERVAWAESKLQVNSRIWERDGIELGADWQEDLRQIEKPVLLVVGDPSLGSVVGETEAEEARRLSRCAQVVRIPGAGHSIHRDQLEAFLAVVVPFLESGSR